jgi:osmotically-inducible protein OsmY
MNDSTLRQDIIDELDFDPSIDAAHIGVAVEDGIVTLTGHLCTYAEKALVEDVVRRVKGVKGIAQEIDSPVRNPQDSRRRNRQAGTGHDQLEHSHS